MAWSDSHSGSDASSYIHYEDNDDDISDRSDIQSLIDNLPSSSGPAADFKSSDIDPGCSTNDEKYDITSTIEHLIVTGNYYRHQHWRVGEWKRNDVGKSVFLMPHVDVHTNDLINSSDGSGVQGGRAFKRQRSQYTIDSNQDHLIHAQDARIYTPDNDDFVGLEPMPWPKGLCTLAKEPHVSDSKWVEELSDPLNPVSFSVMRLSGLSPIPALAVAADNIEVSEGYERPLDYDLDPNINNNDVIPSESSRALLLHCWERAVHAASATMFVDPFEMDSHQQHAAGVRFNNELHGQPTRSRDEAIRVCENLHVHYTSRKEPVNVASDQQSGDVNGMQSHSVIVTPMECSSCCALFSSEEDLQAHFWGTQCAEGCCWRSIECHRGSMVAELLDSEILALVQQLLFLVMKDLGDNPAEIDDAQTSSLLDGFAIWRILKNQLDGSRRIADGSVDSHDLACGTLEVDAFQPPLPINSAVLESVLFRLVDRYGRVPR